MAKPDRKSKKKATATRALNDDVRGMTLLQLYLSIMPPNQSSQFLREKGFQPRDDLSPWPLAIPMDWSANPYKDDNWQYQLHAWRMIDPLLDEYQKKGTTKSLLEAFDYIADWHRFHIRDEKIAKYSWFDMSAGIRAIKIAVLSELVGKNDVELPDASIIVLDELAIKHAKRLQVEEYIANNNHGLWAMLGLRMLANSALKGTHRLEARRFSSRKFKEILDFSYTPEGVHKEHSPSYAALVAKWVDRPAFRRWWPKIGPDIVEKVEGLMPWFTFPDGSIARLGDSLGQGRKGPLSTGVVVALDSDVKVLVKDLSKSGYVIVRSPSDAPADSQSMLVVTGACWSHTHKHVDDLSFELFEFGQNIFIDTGMYSYTRGPMRLYVLSADSHNTISLPKRQILPNDVVVNGTDLEQVVVQNGAVQISGAVSYPTLFSQRRTITYTPRRTLTIHDELESDASQLFSSNLHLAPHLEPTLTKTGFCVALGKGNALEAEFVDRDAEIRMTRGQEVPPLGWSTVKYQLMEPTTLIQALAEGTSRSMTWRITFR